MLPRTPHILIRIIASPSPVQPLARPAIRLRSTSASSVAQRRPSRPFHDGGGRPRPPGSPGRASRRDPQGPSGVTMGAESPPNPQVELGFHGCSVPTRSLSSGAESPPPGRLPPAAARRAATAGSSAYLAGAAPWVVASGAGAGARRSRRRCSAGRWLAPACRPLRWSRSSAPSPRTRTPSSRPPSWPAWAPAGRSSSPARGTWRAPSTISAPPASTRCPPHPLPRSPRAGASTCERTRPFCRFLDARAMRRAEVLTGTAARFFAALQARSAAPEAAGGVEAGA